MGVLHLETTYSKQGNTTVFSICTVFNFCRYFFSPALNGICRVRLLSSVKCNPWLCHQIPRVLMSEACIYSQSPNHSQTAQVSAGLQHCMSALRGKMAGMSNEHFSVMQLSINGDQHQTRYSLGNEMKGNIFSHRELKNERQAGLIIMGKNTSPLFSVLLICSFKQKRKV